MAAHLTRLITDGTWEAGATIPTEGELAQQFGVSRTVVRECVSVLASRGMLDVRQGRGTFVTPPEAWNVTEPLAMLVAADRPALLSWLEVRTILETESSALAAQRHTESDAAALRDALRQLEDADAGHDQDAFKEADIHLHLTIARATRNPALLLLLRPVVQPLREQLHDTAQQADARAIAAHEHRALVECIVAGDADGARRVMAEHLARVVEEIAQVAREEPLR